MATATLPDGKLFGFTTCAQCGELIHQDEALVKTYHTGRSTLQETFCGNQCHYTWYLSRLRSFGL